IAAARFEAKVVVLELVAKVAVLKLGHALEPLLPVTLVVQEKPDAVPPSVRLWSAPGVVAVTVTTLVLTVALTPTLLPFPAALIAVLTFDANVVLLTRAAPDQYSKSAPVVSPSVPPLSVLPLLVMAAFVPNVRPLPVVPGRIAVTVTTLFK